MSAALTDVAGDPRLILARQQSSARYFQRPDRGAGNWLTGRLDSNATALSGAGFYTHLLKSSGDWWWEATFSTRTPGYETNDYAFQRNADYLYGNGNLARAWTEPSRWFRNLILMIGGQTRSNYDGDATGRQLHGGFQTVTPQYWQTTLIGFHRPATFDDHQLRGGPVVEQPASDIWYYQLRSDSRRAVSLHLTASAYDDRIGGRDRNLSVEAAYRPTSNLTVSLGPSWDSFRNAAQYVDAIDDPTAASFYGARYVISTLHQKTLGLDTRLSVTFTPAMTLELYAQPFFAAGAYADSEEYAAPRTSRFFVNGRDVGRIAAARRTDGVVDHYTTDPDGAGPARAFTID